MKAPELLALTPGAADALGAAAARGRPSGSERTLISKESLSADEQLIRPQLSLLADAILT